MPANLVPYRRARSTFEDALEVPARLLPDPMRAMEQSFEKPIDTRVSSGLGCGTSAEYRA
jgi:hypothetical protein